ncbi:MAG TPA: ankyrin repeat domain-containing protein [Thermoanaerobaculia bacterium]|nr:ankyrin repeat domain-containing protein [Thermoanaerobaculia bacterium]
MTPNASELFQAIRSGDREAAERLLDADPSLASARDASGVSALTLATYHARPGIARTIRSHLVEIDAFEAAALGESGRLAELLAKDPSLLSALSPDGFPLLGLTAFFGHLEAAELLLARGADPNAAATNPMHVRPLHAAAATQDANAAVELTKRLLARGADPNASQHGGYTPLHEAAGNGNVALVSLLLAHGADASARSEEGRTPAEVAREKGHPGVADLLA